MSDDKYMFLVDSFLSTLDDDYEKIGKLNNFKMEVPLEIANNEKNYWKVWCYFQID